VFKDYKEKWSDSEHMVDHMVELYKRNRGLNLVALSYMYGDGSNDFVINVIMNSRSFQKYSKIPPEVSGAGMQGTKSIICFIVVHMFGQEGEELTLVGDMDAKNMEPEPHLFDNMYIRFFDAEAREEKTYIAEHNITFMMKRMLKVVREDKRIWTRENYLDDVVLFRTAMTNEEIRRLTL